MKLVETNKHVTYPLVLLLIKLILILPVDKCRGSVNALSQKK